MPRPLGRLTCPLPQPKQEALTALCDSHEHEGAEQRVGQLLAAGASPNTTDEVRGASCIAILQDTFPRHRLSAVHIPICSCVTAGCAHAASCGKAPSCRSGAACRTHAPFVLSAGGLPGAAPGGGPRQRVLNTHTRIPRASILPLSVPPAFHRRASRPCTWRPPEATWGRWWRCWGRGRTSTCGTRWGMHVWRGGCKGERQL